MDFQYDKVGYDFKRLSRPWIKTITIIFSFFLELYTNSIRNNPKYTKLYQIEKYLNLVMAFGEIWVWNKAYVSYFRSKQGLLLWLLVKPNWSWNPSKTSDQKGPCPPPPFSEYYIFVRHRQKVRHILTLLNNFFESCRLPTKKCPNFNIIYENVNNF